MLSGIMVSVIMVSVIMVNVIMVSLIMVSVVMVRVIMVSVVMLNVIMLSVIMLRGIMLSGIMLNAMTSFDVTCSHFTSRPISSFIFAAITVRLARGIAGANVIKLCLRLSCSEAGLLNKGSCLAPTLGVTKFINT